MSLVIEEMSLTKQMKVIVNSGLVGELMKAKGRIYCNEKEKKTFDGSTLFARIS